MPRSCNPRRPLSFFPDPSFPARSRQWWRRGPATGASALALILAVLTAGWYRSSATPPQPAGDSMAMTLPDASYASGTASAGRQPTTAPSMVSAGGPSPAGGGSARSAQSAGQPPPSEPVDVVSYLAVLLLDEPRAAGRATRPDNGCARDRLRQRRPKRMPVDHLPAFRRPAGRAAGRIVTAR